MVIGCGLCATCPVNGVCGRVRHLAASRRLDGVRLLGSVEAFRARPPGGKS